MRAAMAAVALLPLLLCAAIAWETRTRALDDAEADMRRVVSAVSEQSLKLLETQALVLDLADRAAGDRDCPALRADAELQFFMTTAVRRATQVDAAWVTDAEGFLCISSNLDRMDNRSRAFRGYFSGARDAPRGSFFVDRAIIGLMDGIPAFTVARRRGEGEAFIGIMLSAVALRDMIGSWNETIRITPTQRIALVRTDGATLARSWEPLVPPVDAEAERRIATTWASGPQGSARRPSVLDGEARLGAWRTLPGWNVVVISSIAEAQALAPWRRSVTRYALVALLASAALGSLLWLLLRTQKRLQGVNAGLEAAIAERTAALSDSEALLREALEAGSLVAWQWDIASGEVRRSANAAALLGIGATGQADDFRPLIHPEDRERAAEARREALRGGAPYDVEYRFQAPDGRELWLADRATVERDPSGRALRLTGVLRDITAQRQADAERQEREARDRFLLALEERLRAAPTARAAVDAACEALGRQVGAACAGVAEVEPDGEHATVESEWRAGDTPSSLGPHVLGDFGRPRVAPLLRGEAVVVTDMEKDPRTADNAVARAAYASLHVRASMDVPLMRDGRLRAILFVADREPRAWTAAEVALAHETLGRAWQAAERARAEEALREREAALARAQRLTGVAGFEMEPLTGRARRSPEYLALHGLETEKVDGSHETWRNRVHPEDLPGAERALDDALAGRTPRYAAEYRIRHGDPAAGGWRWIAAQGDVERDAGGRAVLLRGAHLDISVRKEAEAVLARFAAERQTEVARRDARLGAWFAHTAEHIFVVAVTPDGRFVFEGLNPAHERATGLSSEALRGRAPAEVFPPALAAELEGNYRRCVEAGEPIHYEEHLELPGGRKRWETCLVPVRDPATGRIELILGSSRDVTEQRRLQAREAQGRRLEALGQLAGGIAHDINNVMQAVQGGAGLIRRRAEDAAAVDQLARMVEDAAQRGAAVTRRLLAFARRGELRAGAVAVDALFSSLAEMLAHTLGPAIRLRAAAPPGLPPLAADRDQLETVLVNLATNGRDAMPDGGALEFSAGEVAIGPGEVLAEAASLAPGRFVRIDVRDSGEGMSPEVLNRATEPFFTTKELGRGTGLGLAMARSFAEQSGGALALRSVPRGGANGSPAGGTTVSLWLPAAGIGAEAAPAAPAPAPPARLLLVDDEELVREVVAQGLEEHGFAVLRAPSGAAALAMLRAGAAADLLLSDYAIPGMNGRALIEAAQRLRPGLPALLLTGNMQDGLGLAAPGFRTLRKPATAEQLRAEIEAMLREAGERMAAAPAPPQAVPL
jgi:PAS domain S-box-containing protein